LLDYTHTRLPLQGYVEGVPRRSGWPKAAVGSGLFSRHWELFCHPLLARV